MYKAIPGTDLSCFSLCLGGVPLGSTLSQKESEQMMDLYIEHGGNFIDTAEVYANWLPHLEKSSSEKTIGRWMKKRSNRQQLIVSTKGAHPPIERMTDSRLSKKEIEQDIHESLKNLQVDVIDLYFLHRDDKSRPVSDVIETMNEQVKAGTIRFFGCSNWAADRIAEAQEYAKTHGLQGFSANQPMYSLAYINPEKLADQTLVTMDSEMKTFHLKANMPAFAYTSQAKGLFAKLHQGKWSFGSHDIDPAYDNEKNKQRLGRIQQLAEKKDLTINQVVLGYLLSQPFPVFPIIGCRTTEQLTGNLRAAAVQFTEEETAFLEGAV